MAKISFGTCDAVTPEIDAICGLIIEDKDGCTCWVNMPTFKSNSLLIRTIAKLGEPTATPQLLYLDIPDDGGYYTSEPGAAVDGADAIAAFLAGVKAKTIARKQLE